MENEGLRKRVASLELWKFMEVQHHIQYTNIRIAGASIHLLLPANHFYFEFIHHIGKKLSFFSIFNSKFALSVQRIILHRFVIFLHAMITLFFQTYALMKRFYFGIKKREQLIISSMHLHRFSSIFFVFIFLKGSVVLDVSGYIFSRHL